MDKIDVLGVNASQKHEAIMRQLTANIEVQIAEGKRIAERLLRREDGLMTTAT